MNSNLNVIYIYINGAFEIYLEKCQVMYLLEYSKIADVSLPLSMFHENGPYVYCIAEYDSHKHIYTGYSKQIWCQQIIHTSYTTL